MRSVFDRQNRERGLQGFIDALQNSPLVVLDAWDEQLWVLLVGQGIVYRDGSIKFLFRDGERARIEACLIVV